MMSDLLLLKSLRNFYEIDYNKNQLISILSNDKKISLGIKQLEENPWNDIEDKYRNRIEKMGNLIQFLMDYIRFLNYKHYKELTEEKNKIN